MADTYKKVVQDLSYDLDQVSESFKDISRLQKGVIKGFTEITQTSTATGQAWISVARFFSGSAFWRIQNKVKAISNALQFMQRLEEKRNKQMEDRMGQLAKTEKHHERLLRIQEKMAAVQSNSAEYTDYKAVMENKMFQLYKKEHGMKKATLMIQGKITDSIEKVLEFEEDLGKIRALNYSKTVKGAAKKTYDSYTQEAQVLMLQIKDLQDEGKMLNDMIGRMPAGVKDGTDEEKQQFKDRKEAEQKRKDIVDKLNDKNAQWTGMSDDDKMQGGVGKSFMRGFGRGFDAKSFSKLKGVAPFDKLFNVMDKLNMVKDGLASVFNRKFVQKLGSFVGTALRFLVKFLIYGALIVLMLMMFKAAGGFELIKNIWDVTKTSLLFIGDIFLSAMGDLFDFFEYGLKFVNALFTGSTEEAMGFGFKMLEAGTKFIVKMIGVVVGLLLTLLVGIVGGIIKWAHKKFFEGKGILAGFVTFIVAAIGAYAAGVIAANMLSSLNPAVAAMGVAAMAVAGFSLGGWIGSGITSGMASGGLTSHSGSFLVGERGPELINLPAGSRVHNNSNTRNMSGGGQTINVSVNGRVGASDSELRDIANKIGRMVNMEMNRNTHRGVRGA